MCKQRFDITAIIYDKKGNILAIGKNSYVKTHTLQAKYAERVGRPDKKFVHAEILAIARCRDLSKAHKIFISRYYKDGTPAPAAPCPICLSAIKDMTNIKIIEHS